MRRPYVTPVALKVINQLPLNASTVVWKAFAMLLLHREKSVTALAELNNTTFDAPG